MTAHPAKFSDEIMPMLQAAVDRCPWSIPRVLDPFAGTGRVHELKRCITVGIEIEPEWAAMSDKTLVGDATQLSSSWDDMFHMVITSPTYGNRMADHHEARDTSRRITYRHLLGRPLHHRSTAGMQWGFKYRTMHEQAWREVMRVLKPGGWFVLNIRDHYRKKELVQVTAWHIDTILKLGFELVVHEFVHTPGMRFGANADLRVAGESVITFIKPIPNPKGNT